MRQWLAVAGCGAAMILAAAAAAPAATIAWGPATTIAGDSDVSTTGTLVHAANAGDDAPATVNGVTFVAMPTTTSGPFALTSAGALIKVASQYGIDAAPYNTLSAGHRELLGSGWFTHTPPATPPAVTLTISALTPGTAYEFQWWVHDARATDDFTRTTSAAAAAGGTSVVLQHNVQDAGGGVGQFAVGTFVADAATQQIVFRGAGGNANAASTQINAMQLRVVPEPSSLALAVLAALGVIRRPART